jgi:hypothetical protein
MMNSLFFNFLNLVFVNDVQDNVPVTNPALLTGLQLPIRIFFRSESRISGYILIMLKCPGVYDQIFHKFQLNYKNTPNYCYY